MRCLQHARQNHTLLFVFFPSHNDVRPRLTPIDTGEQNTHGVITRSRDTSTNQAHSYSFFQKNKGKRSKNSTCQANHKWRRLADMGARRGARFGAMGWWGTTAVPAGTRYAGPALWCSTLLRCIGLVVLDDWGPLMEAKLRPCGCVWGIWGRFEGDHV